MKPWKAALGLGAACAACCAVPLLGGAAALTAGSASLAAVGSALLACADELAPLAFALLGLAAVGGAAILWAQRRRRAHFAASSCSTPRQATATKGCGCPPGNCA